MTVNAGANQLLILPNNSLTLNGSVSAPVGQTPTIAWSEVSGPGITFSTPNLALTSATVTAPGTYVLRLTAADSNATSTNDVTVTVYPIGTPQPTPPTVSAGSGQTTLQLGNPPSTVSTTLTGSVTATTGTPTVGWSEVSGPAAVTFGSLNQAVTTVQFSVAGTYVLQLSAAVPGAGQGNASVTITVLSPPLQPPVVSAGSNTSVQLPNTTVTLNGSARDLGGNPLTLAWTQLNGPSTVTFATPTQAVTQATLTTAGTYLLQLSASNAQYTSVSTVQVIVVPQGGTNTAPVVTAGTNQTVTLPSITTTLNGTVTDDGLPVGVPLTITWAVVSGPGPVTFANAHSPVTQATFSANGAYVLQLTASDTQFSTTAQTTVTLQEPVNLAPVVTVPSAFTMQLPNGTATLNATATDDGLPLGSALRVTWTASPATVTFANLNAAVTTATFPAAGSYTLTLTATDSALTTIKTVAVTVLPAPTPPTVSTTLPDGTEITQPTAVKATISNGTWTLQYALYNSASLTQSYTTLASGSGAVSNAIIATFDPTLLLNGTYQLLLSATDNVGQITTTSTTITVSRNMKIGVFSLAFNDLTVPLSGLPITVTRSYDSRDKGVGDFGVGWRVAVSNIRLQKNHPLSSNWFEDLEYAALTPAFCISSTNSKIVTIVFPNNQVYKFQAQASPACQQIVAITNPTVTFQQISATAGTAGATLAPIDGGSAVIDGSPPAVLNLVGLDGNFYDPTTFVLTLANGMSYVIDQALGLISMTDTNANTLTFTANNITSSTGQGVNFTRDAQGRITQITDPNGKSLTYIYNGADLATFTDRTGAQTAFGYQAGDYLTGITLPNGTQALTNSYDPSTGRLLGTADAFGNNVAYNHNIAANTETVTDRLGNATTYVYDQDGNILSTTDALGHVTSSTYDSSDNKLSDTDALGRKTTYVYDGIGNLRYQTDPLGNVTGYTYNVLQRPLTVTDPLGNVTTNTYDGHGNLATTKDAAGNTTTNVYDNRGNLTSTTDALTHATTFFYDRHGNLSTQTDALNNVTTNTYDLNGNRLTQSVTRTFNNAPQTLLTQFAYDGQNRLTKTTFPDGSATQTHYNSPGQVDIDTDELGHQTQYVYDSDGRRTTTTYADGTTSNTQYDANGNRTQTTNRGIVTSFVYDKINCLTQTTSAPNTANAATRTTNYDAGSQVISTVDALGNPTTYVYDNAGRRTKVQNALNQVTTSTYDAAGNQLTVKDANGNTTTNAYDADNRLIKTTYPDAKFDSTAYDAVGNVQSRTDANGNTTTYGYDALNRLTSVTDALSQVTSYGYDEVGSRISQTDANSHTTSYQFDQRGRRIGRTLPAGQSEGYAYDLGGNLQSRTDFKGKTTTYAYDTLNRLLSKTPDSIFNAGPVSFTYTATGRRQSMADPSGTTTYTYDNRDRLVSKANPEGTLSYNYDLANNLTVLSTTGLSVSYTYDVLNRVSAVAEPNTGTTGYAYDAVGNLGSFTTPNGVSHAYTYDQRNRLTNLALGTTITPPAGYTYTLDAVGHRTSVAELSGRTVGYNYDNIYRLTGETIACSVNNPTCGSGAIGYTYDRAGNRKQTTSTQSLIATGQFSYDANDRLSTDTYDDNGNTTVSQGVTSTYDFENHLIGSGPNITIVYDGDGNRVKKTVNGVTTTYLVDDLNPTGYTQVVVETIGGDTRQYVYGLERLSQRRVTAAVVEVRYIGYDGHRSVRLLTESNGAVTDTYEYDAFGNIVNSTGTTPNEFMFAGEQFDRDLGLYYNRARYYKTDTGRFWTADSHESQAGDPLGIHRYTYAANSPVSLSDPSGLDYISDPAIGAIVQQKVGAEFVNRYGADACIDQQIAVLANPQGRCPTPWVFGLGSPLGWRVDLANKSTGALFEIKPILQAYTALNQLLGYRDYLNFAEQAGRNWHTGDSSEFMPPSPVYISPTKEAYVVPPIFGVIVYFVVDLRDTLPPTAAELSYRAILAALRSRGASQQAARPLLNLIKDPKLIARVTQTETAELEEDFGVATIEGAEGAP